MKSSSSGSRGGSIVEGFVRGLVVVITFVF